MGLFCPLMIGLEQAQSSPRSSLSQPTLQSCGQMSLSLLFNGTHSTCSQVFHLEMKSSHVLYKSSVLQIPFLLNLSEPLAVGWGSSDRKQTLQEPLCLNFREPGQSHVPVLMSPAKRSFLNSIGMSLPSTQDFRG